MRRRYRSGCRRRACRRTWYRTRRTCWTTTRTCARAGYYRRLEHPETGRSAYDGPIVGLHETPGDLRWAAPLFGEHTYEVATRILGYSDDEVSELAAAGHPGVGGVLKKRPRA